MSERTGNVGSLTELEEKDDDGGYGRWISEIELAEKELGPYWEKAEQIEKRFLDERDAIVESDRRFNIFASNVSILKSSLFNQIPKVDCSRTFKDTSDDIARVAALIIQRILQQDLDLANPDFVPVIKYAIQDRLVPGMGLAWIRLETTTQALQMPPTVDPTTGEEVPSEETSEVITNQKACTETVNYRDFLYSPCRIWEERRWVGRQVRMDRDSLVKRFGEEKGKAVNLDFNPLKSQSGTTEPQHRFFAQARVYEIWDRTRREVIWVSRGHKEILDRKPDPLRLEGFDPCPQPMFATMTTSRCVPTPDFVLWQDQYNELDVVNTRISYLVEACKVVGVYDKTSEGIQSMLSGGENRLIPVDNWAMFAEKGGIKGQIDWLPLDMVVKAIEVLRVQREDIKQQIFELTGLADIVRGATKASETLGAQEIKAKFASVRIQDLQTQVKDFADSIQRIKAEIIAKHFTPDIIKQKANTAGLEMADQQFVDQAIALIKDSKQFSWRVSIQPDSMAQMDYTQLKEERAEFLTAISSFMEKAVMGVQAMPQLLPLMVALLKFGVAGFRPGKEIEGMLDSVFDQLLQQSQQGTPGTDPKVEAETTAIKEESAAKVEAIKAKTAAQQEGQQAKMVADQQSRAAKQETDQVMAAAKLIQTMRQGAVNGGQPPGNSAQ